MSTRPGRFSNSLSLVLGPTAYSGFLIVGVVLAWTAISSAPKEAAAPQKTVAGGVFGDPAEHNMGRNVPALDAGSRDTSMSPYVVSSQSEPLPSPTTPALLRARSPGDLTPEGMREAVNVLTAQNANLIRQIEKERADTEDMRKEAEGLRATTDQAKQELEAAQNQVKRANTLMEELQRERNMSAAEMDRLRDLLGPDLSNRDPQRIIRLMVALDPDLPEAVKQKDPSLAKALDRILRAKL